MSDRRVLAITILLLGFMLLTSTIVLRQLTDGWMPSENVAESSELSMVRCADKDRLPRSATSDPQLGAVAEYEAVCDSTFFDTMMIFTSMPADQNQVNDLADRLSSRLKAFDLYGIRPIAVVEPVSPYGPIDFNKYAQGWYDKWVDMYFARLKQNGITDEQLGIWTPFPEPQKDYWNNQNPDDFALSFNRHVTQLRKYFPAARTAILLDSQASEGEILQLTVYTRLIQHDLVNVAGLQGFPWHPSSGDTRAEVTSAATFAPAYVLEELADALGVKDVLINTGTYRHRLAADGSEIVIPTDERRETLDSIAYEAATLKQRGYSVTVNVFAQNKLGTPDGVDWSYWDPNVTEELSHAALFTQFAQDLLSAGIAVSLFDVR